MKRTTLQWWEDLGTFLRHPGEAPPDHVSDQLRAAVYRDLTVDVSKLVTKTLFTFALAGLAVVSVCPQLGVGPFFADSAVAEGLAHVFHAGGALACAALCGALFVGLGTLISVLALRRAELRWAYRRRTRATLVMAMTGLVALALFGGESDGIERFFWLLGAMVSAAIVMEVLGRWRLSAAARRPATALP